MKKTIIIMMMFILLIPLAFALYGGETWTYTFDECDKLKVNITAIDTIDEGEYTILNDCTENGTNYHLCDCYNDYNFTVQFHPGAINNYTFIFNYEYSRYVQDEDNGGGSSGSGYRSGGGVFTTTLKLNQSITKLLRPNMISRINIKNKQHTVKITKIGDGYVTVDIQDKLLTLTLNKQQMIDFEDDNFYDLAVILKTISGKTARIEFKHINESYEIDIIDKDITIDEINETEPINGTDLLIEEDEEEEEKSYVFWIVLGIIIAILLIIGGIWYFVYK